MIHHAFGHLKFEMHLSRRGFSFWNCYVFISIWCSFLYMKMHFEVWASQPLQQRSHTNESKHIWNDKRFRPIENTVKTVLWTKKLHLSNSLTVMWSLTYCIVRLRPKKHREKGEKMKTKTRESNRLHTELAVCFVNVNKSSEFWFMTYYDLFIKMSHCFTSTLQSQQQQSQANAIRQHTFSRHTGT